MAEQLGLHRPRGYGHHPHADVRHLFPDVLGQGMHRKLGGAVGGMVRESLATGDGADVDDGAAAARLHSGQHGMHAVQHPHDIDVEHLLPLGRILHIGLTQQHDASIVDQTAHWAELRLGLLDGSLHGGGVGDVDADTECFGQVQRLHGLDPAGQQQQGVTGGREGAGDGGTDPGGGTGDHDEGLGHGYFLLIH
ncbi:hypothetical protein D3C75_527470 [compost metagenome]